MHTHHQELSEAISGLTDELLSLRMQCQSENRIGHLLGEMEKRIMSKIREFADAQNTFNDQIDGAIAGLNADVKTLNDTIAKLQGTPGSITAEDQALLDAIQARSMAIVGKLTALDALTPPEVPVDDVRP